MRVALKEDWEISNPLGSPLLSPSNGSINQNRKCHLRRIKLTKTMSRRCKSKEPLKSLWIDYLLNLRMKMSMVSILIQMSMLVAKFQMHKMMAKMYSLYHP